MNYIAMAWKTTTKVGFGITGGYAVARFCGDVDISTDVDSLHDNVSSQYGECTDTDGKEPNGKCIPCDPYTRGQKDK